MNILFLNYRYPNPECGGSERSIYKIAKYLTGFNFNVYVGFFEGSAGNVAFIKDYINLTPSHISTTALISFIIMNKIDIIVNFQKYCLKSVKDAIKKTYCHYIVSYRFAPNDAIIKTSSQLDDRTRYKGAVWTLKRVFRKKYLAYIMLVSRYKIRKHFNLAEKWILISERSYLPFISLNKIKKDRNKILWINNSVSFDVTCSPNQIWNKDSIVLVVARMEEKTKRISLALDIWRKAIHERLAREWKLLIIGEGGDLTRYQTYVDKLSIPNVQFLGQRDPQEFYLKAAIFMMTSAAEGFSNTLPEALQTGCVPIVFDSFPAVHDVIHNNLNGFIVNNNDIENYVNKLRFLMNNSEIRIKMALEAVHESERFSINIIGKKWKDLFLEVNNN